MLGYKHTDAALLKLVERFKIKTNHPMYGKAHTEEAKRLISKHGEKNPMYGKTHSDATKALLSTRRIKYPLGFGLYDLNLIKKFHQNVELARYLDISKPTVEKYIKTGKFFKALYYIKIISE